MKFAASVALAAPTALLLDAADLPAVPGIAWWGFPAVAGVLAAHWAPGHDWTNPWRLAVRYSPAPVVVALFLWWCSGATMFLPIALAGPVTVAAYTLAHRNPGWFTPGPAGDGALLFDGTIAGAEVTAGAVVYGPLWGITAHWFLWG